MLSPLLTTLLSFQKLRKDFKKKTNRGYVSHDFKFWKFQKLMKKYSVEIVIDIIFWVHVKIFHHILLNERDIFGIRNISLGSLKCQKIIR